MSAKARKFDVYEDEDADAARFEKRFKDVGVIDEDIQGRADFEDEEIDEDGAFDADDESKYGEVLRTLTQRKRKVSNFAM